MGERRPLIDGIKSPLPPVDPDREREFIQAAKVKGRGELTSPSTTVAAASRSPLSTRIRSDFATALKRASLERQLNGLEPHLLCNILEQALEPWLKANGYLN